MNRQYTYGGGGHVLYVGWMRGMLVYNIPLSPISRVMSTGDEKRGGIAWLDSYCGWRYIL